jgi:trk system potassium uptake protein TrkH
MNRKLITRTLADVLLIEAFLMIPSLIVTLYYKDGDTSAFIWTMLALVGIGLPVRLTVKPKDSNLKAKDGFITVALAWMLLSLFGGLPMLLSGMLPRIEDAVFESVSGFTTTGASVMSDFQDYPRGVMFWRSFTHWIGGMGILVFTLAILPKVTGHASLLAMAESPGPAFSRLTPRISVTAKLLYLIYAVLTAVLILVLILLGMRPYDAMIHGFGTAGTGGFSNDALSVGQFHSASINAVITVFMILFGVNFAVYYKLITGSWREALRSEELRWYLVIVSICIILVTVFITPVYGNALSALNHGSFQVASLISTSGYATADFNLWPQAAKMVLLFVMMIGASAGSTAGGLKIIRFGILIKAARRALHQVIQPRKTQVLQFEAKRIDEPMLQGTGIYFFAYCALVFLGAVLIMADGRYDMLTNMTAALTAVNNVGPGLGAVGPAGSFAGYSAFSKYVLSFLMLAGRLEIYPMLMLLLPSTWRS